MWFFKNIRNEINGVTFWNGLTIIPTNELYRDFRPTIPVQSFIKIGPSACSLRHENIKRDITHSPDWARLLVQFCMFIHTVLTIYI